MAITIPNTFADKSGQVQLQDLDENFSQVASGVAQEIATIQNVVNNLEDPVAMGLVFGPDAQPDYETSFATNGYQKFPSGLIMQWGVTTGTADPTSVTFPIAFPNACLNVTATYFSNVAIGTATSAIKVKTVSTSGATFALNGVVANWLAIGY